ncbi:DUF3757 domain-containing protein [Legionella brunensis]|nr:DUF3757 domain-containing protein [Legionella brunensis]
MAGLLLFTLTSKAAMLSCPDPDTTSLKWGVIPKPWIENPYSPNRVQGEDGTRFVRANIMVAGMGRGVVCAYSNSLGLYSIWWPVRVKIPARTDYNWIDTYGGFVCTQSLTDCIFSIATD